VKKPTPYFSQISMVAKTEYDGTVFIPAFSFAQNCVEQVIYITVAAINGIKDK